ncbi:hypothetical protein GUJ93_ZPchr0014g47155 [Zizania palustris]|uniref:Secreted protein n=1 Tax=Zizania palustris TaxID=103762 RepID=A0A8J5VSC8_ZIZPA|nr:hypothetical protein GUJ93_ZPchr0014g47155 [Zizania palustris]
MLRLFWLLQHILVVATCLVSNLEATHRTISKPSRVPAGLLSQSQQVKSRPADRAASLAGFIRCWRHKGSIVAIN